MKETVRLRDFFKRYSNEVITIIGSGGKTSLLWFLARCFAGGAVAGVSLSGDRPPCRGATAGEASGSAEHRVLVTTTTKMGAPDFESGLFDHFINGLSIDMIDADTRPLPAIKPGITFAGNHEKGASKTTALPSALLSSLIQSADVTLIEGDGSKTLPLKGWADDEPVVPPFTTVTVGVIPLWPLGMPITEAIVHRLPRFCALTGAGEADMLTTSHLAAAVSGGTDKDGTERRGLFAEACGKRVLFFNQAEDEKALRQAGEIMGLLPAAFRASLNAAIVGSVKGDRCLICGGICGF
jgi:probable selenium-dependent hydroxylase accessory protein YqeC